MAENKTMDKIHRDILKKFHTLCSVLGLTDDQKKAIAENCLEIEQSVGGTDESGHA